MLPEKLPTEVAPVPAAPPPQDVAGLARTLADELAHYKLELDTQNFITRNMATLDFNQKTGMSLAEAREVLAVLATDAAARRAFAPETAVRVERLRAYFEGVQKVMKQWVKEPKTLRDGLEVTSRREGLAARLGQALRTLQA